MQNKMIVIDGVDGAGKGVQTRALVDIMNRAGLDTILTREPGGSAAAEEIRALLVTGDTEKWDSMTELLLMYASRKSHVRDTILPALNNGQWVVCDRFADSSRAFQGVAGMLGLDCVEELHQLVLGDFKPDLVLILDLPESVALERTFKRADSEDRFENKGLEYHKLVRQAFRKIAQGSPNLHAVVDAEKPIDSVTDTILSIINSAFELSPPLKRL
ncbi:MAG: dTMP kinase [Gammaproteobacteria bacterium]|jgi:dTMP kinase